MLDGYRLWVRDPGDVLPVATPSASPGASPGPSASPRASGSASPRASASPVTVPGLSIAVARQREGKRVTVEGTVTVATTLLDASGRRTIVEDGTAAIELYLARADTTVRTGVRVRATGVVGRAWGAPRLRVEAIRVLGPREPVVHELRVAPAAGTEWRLVRVVGTLAEVHRSGDRWTAELVSEGRRIPLLGLPGAEIAASTVQEGRRATLTGIVKRPYPTAKDRRFAVVPRSARDLALGSSSAGTSPGSAGVGGSSVGTAAPGSPGPSSDPANGRSNSPTGASTPSGADVLLADLAARLGETVRVGGVVSAVEPDAFRSVRRHEMTTRIVLEGPAIELAALLQPGDTVNATGTPELRDEVVLLVTDPAGVVLLGDLGGDGGQADGHCSRRRRPRATTAIAPVSTPRPSPRRPSVVVLRIPSVSGCPCLRLQAGSRRPLRPIEPGPGAGGRGPASRPAWMPSWPCLRRPPARVRPPDRASRDLGGPRRPPVRAPAARPFAAPPSTRAGSRLARA